MANPIIYQRTIASGDADGTVEKGVRIQNGCFARQFGDSDWTRIRMGIRFRIYDINETGFTTLSGTPKFGWGFCNGTTKIPGDQTWDNWAGLVSTDNSGWTQISDYWYIYNNSTNNTNLFTGSVGYTLADLENLIGITNYDYNAAHYVGRWTSSAQVALFDLHKLTDETFQSSMFFRGNTTNGTEYVSDADFLTLLESDAPARTGYNRITWLSAGQGFTSSVLTYPLNSVFVYWERTDPAIELIDLYVVRLS